MLMTLISAQVHSLLCGHDNAMSSKKPKCTLKSSSDHPYELTYLSPKHIPQTDVLEILLFSLEFPDLLKGVIESVILAQKLPVRIH